MSESSISAIKMLDGTVVTIEDATALSSITSLVNNGRVLPTVSTSDNGKILRVVGGVWSAEELPVASGVSF